MKVDQEKREALIALTRRVFNNTESYKEVIKAIEQDFGVKYCRSCARYWVLQAFPEKWEEKLKGQEKIMNKWRSELEKVKKDNLKEIEAERLGMLFSGQITQKEYDGLHNG